jgi:virulence-associated protein VagC
LGKARQFFRFATRRLPLLRQTAKIFTSRDSQIVHLPAGVRFTGSEVLVQQDPDTGEVILTEKSQTWDDFFAARDAAIAAGEVPDDFIDLEARKREVHDRNPVAKIED